MVWDFIHGPGYYRSRKASFKQVRRFGRRIAFGDGNAETEEDDKGGGTVVEVPDNWFYNRTVGRLSFLCDTIEIPIGGAIEVPIQRCIECRMPGKIEIEL